MAPLRTATVLVCTVLLVVVSSSRIDFGDCSSFCAFRKILGKAGFSSDVVVNTGLCDCESIFSTGKRKEENESKISNCDKICKDANENRTGPYNYCPGNCNCSCSGLLTMPNGKRGSEIMNSGDCSRICAFRRFLVKAGFPDDLVMNTGLCDCDPTFSTEKRGKENNVSEDERCKNHCAENNLPSGIVSSNCKCKRSEMMNSDDCSRICAFRRFLVKAGFPDDLVMNTGLCDCDPTFSTEKREQSVRCNNLCIGMPRNFQLGNCRCLGKRSEMMNCSRICAFRRFLVKAGFPDDLVMNTGLCDCDQTFSTQKREQSVRCINLCAENNLPSGMKSSNCTCKRSEIERREETTTTAPKFNCTAHCITNPCIKTQNCRCFGCPYLFKKKASYRGRREEPTKLDCTKHCQEKKYPAGDCHCLSLWKKRPSYSEGNDGSRDFLLRELLKDYFLQNEENDEK